MQTSHQDGSGSSGMSSSGGQFPTSENVSSSAHRLADRAHETIDRVSGKVQPTVDALTEKASHTVDAVSQKAEQFHEMQENALESTRTYVRENPIAAIGIAAVVGLLLGRMRH